MIEWREGQPYSTQFQDVYFSSDDGLAETDYVFLQSNNLSYRWENLATNHFTIIETGFGTGLNFLCACKKWLSVAPQHATLHFISVEKYPLSLPDITKALQAWPTLQIFSQALLVEYSHALSQKEAVPLFDGRIQLKLCVGDASECLSKMSTHADVWFLDGFAPSKNPDMWSEAVFKQMARLSNNATTFATFTSAGMVKRGLSAAGFGVNKKSGFGKKREMLCGQFIGNVI